MPTKITAEVNGLIGYSAWLGKPAVLVVAVGERHVRLSCNIVGESVGDVRIKIKAGQEIDVQKKSILAVEEIAVELSGSTSSHSDYLN